MIDKRLAALYRRGRMEHELYCRDLVRDGEAMSIEHAKNLIKHGKHVAVPIYNEPKGGMMHDVEEAVWFGK